MMILTQVSATTVERAARKKKKIAGASYDNVETSGNKERNYCEDFQQ